MTEARALAEQVGYDLVVADTVNHLLRGVRLTGDAPVVTTLAGTGEQFMVGANDNVVGSPGAQAPFEADGPTIRLSSPWDVLWAPATERVIVAMAGNHTIWDFDPATGVIRQLSGTMNEGLRDATAPGEDAWYAQTSGLSLSADGTVWLADSETSALRRLDPRDGTVTTQVGVGLFDFGFQDGPAAEARLQHPLGVAELPDGSVAIADTYNGAIRRYDPQTEEVTTLARGLAEPSDILVVLPEDTENEGWRAPPARRESAAHQLTAVAIPREALRSPRAPRQTKRPATTINDQALDVAIGFTVPAGQKLDDRWGDPTACGLLDPARAHRQRRRRRGRPDPVAHARSPGGLRRPPHHGACRGLRRGTRRRDPAPRGLPPLPAGLGHPCRAGPRRGVDPAAGPPRHELIAFDDQSARHDLSARLDWSALDVTERWGTAAQVPPSSVVPSPDRLAANGSIRGARRRRTRRR